VVLVRLVPAVLHVQLPVALVRLVPVALAQVASQVLRVQAVPQVPVALQVLAALLVRPVARPVVEVAALAAEPQVLSVRVVLAVRARLVSQSVQSAKSLNSAATPHHWVAH
jgi:hypothetical protein